MTPILHRTRSDASDQPWPDQWLADAAAASELGVSLHLVEFLGLHSAWEALICAGLNERDILDLACDASRTPAADLTRVGPADALLMRVRIARAYDVAPVGTDGPMIIVATANPMHPSLRDDLERETQFAVQLATASPSSIRVARRRIYSRRPSARPSGSFQRVSAARLKEALIVHERDTPPDGLEWLRDLTMPVKS